MTHLALLFDPVFENGFNFLVVSAFGNIEGHDDVVSRLGRNEPFNGLLFCLRIGLEMEAVAFSAIWESDSFATMETKAQLLLLMGRPRDLGLAPPDSGPGQLSQNAMPDHPEQKCVDMTLDSSAHGVVALL